MDMWRNSIVSSDNAPWCSTLLHSVPFPSSQCPMRSMYRSGDIAFSTASSFCQSCCCSVLYEEVVSLIQSQQIEAKIDSEQQLLCRCRDNMRQTSFSNAVALTKRFLQENKALLVRLNLIKHDLMQKQTPGGDRRSKKASTVEFTSEPTF